MKSTAAGYYISSLITLLKQVNNPLSFLGLAFGTPGETKTSVVSLRSGETFYIRSFLDVWVIKETVIDRQYETGSIVLQDGWNLIDIGAAMGDYSVWAARQIPHGMVVAVEPYPDSVHLLYQNLAANHIKNVKVIEKAVSGMEGQVELNLVGNSLVQHSTTRSNAPGSTTRVSSLTLAELLNESQMARCDYLKMDCEGGEFDILFNSSSETLLKFDRICMEVHEGVTQFSRQDMLRFLEGKGYQTRVTSNPVHDYLALIYAHRPGLI